MSSDATTIKAKIESLTAEKAKAQAALTKAREVKQEVEGDLRNYGATMDANQRTAAAANVEELRQTIKKLRRKIETLTGKIARQREAADLAAQAASLAEQVVTRAAAIDEEPDEDQPEPEPENARPRRGMGLGGLGLALALGALLLSRR